MENYKLVLPEHLNHYGYLFGGTLLKWVDEVCYISASLYYPGCNFVTIAMDRVEFRRSVKKGSILRFDLRQVKTGTTSVQYAVDVFKGAVVTDSRDSVFSTHTTLVRIGDDGRKIPLPAGSAPRSGGALP